MESSSQREVAAVLYLCDCSQHFLREVSLTLSVRSSALSWQTLMYLVRIPHRMGRSIDRVTTMSWKERDVTCEVAFRNNRLRMSFNVQSLSTYSTSFVVIEMCRQSHRDRDLKGISHGRLRRRHGRIQN